jgi:hypothetical protein
MTTKAFNMKERKEPEFISFSDGEMVEGVLLNIDRIPVGETKQMTNRYTVRDIENRENLYSFLGTHQIDTKLSREDIGHVVSVRCEGVDHSVQRNGNAMKKFKVLVSDVPYNVATRGRQLEDGTYITNEDIGF